MSTPGTPSPEQLRILLARAERENLDASIIERLRVILYFAEHRHSISEVSRQFGISRSTFHRWIERFDPENLSSLADKSHEPLRLRQSAIDQQSVELIRRYRMRYPQMGKERIAELLLADHGVELSSSCIGRVIERECLYFADTPFHWKKRLEKKTSSPQPVITDTGSVALTHEPSVQHVVVEPEPDTDEPSTVETIVAVKPLSWKSLKRVIIVSSVITNIAFVSLLLGSALLEHVSKPAPSDVQLQTLHAAPAANFIP